VRGNDPSLAAHQILVEPGTRLAAIFGAGAHPVNSRHHQAVGRVGAGLRVTARSTPDGVIEALERDDPEDQARRGGEQRRLFEAFAEALG
jgi:putative glutamine amidotransferase